MDELTPHERAHLGVLESTFPGWRFTVLGGVWWATRHDPPTHQQRSNGVRHQIASRGPVDLVEVLFEQLGILSRMRST
ncbi:hypothetical protein [Spongiactinospora sp. TRM90649]|uniref:hypothetical protein n=1 Tax=Spongiactinospora sp. TRM90649 TaxID=3031114 RepID=UPI0023F7FFFA|nr:hypothetical protein [Spongiactinospora sp. TRM90649]MDF5754177.1 hypothetical protein [Spongiactinospora sp. TRM90649]